MKTLAVLDFNRRRTDRLVSGFQDWCQSRNLGALVFGEQSVGELTREDVQLLYLPLTRDLRFLENVDPGLPLVLDYDGANGDELIGGPLLEGRRVAFRRAFGGRTPWTPEIQVPYFHWPTVGERSRLADTVIFDTHQWLRPSFHLALLGLVDALRLHCAKLEENIDTRIQFYISGGVDAKHYLDILDAAERFGPGLRTFLEERLLPVAETKKSFDEILARTLLFVTDHGDIADQDVSEVLALGRPIYVQARDPFRTPTKLSSTHMSVVRKIAPELESAINRANQVQERVENNPVAGILSRFQEPGPRQLLMDVYDVSWTVLLRWSERRLKTSGWESQIEKSPSWGSSVR